MLQFDKVDSESATADDLSHRFLWGPAVDLLFADEQVDGSDEDADGQTLWALGDHLGSVRDVVDSNADPRIHRVFDAFGNIVDEIHYIASGGTVTIGQAGFVDLAFAFTGRYFDSAIGLQNNLNRWYDPNVGRWLSEDPIGFEAGDANLYRYVGNQPADLIDPTGQRWVPPNPPLRPRPEPSIIKNFHHCLIQFGVRHCQVAGSGRHAQQDYHGSQYCQCPL